MKKGLIFLNGDPPSPTVLQNMDFSDKIVVCADGAYNYLKNYDANPDILLGDFDSITSVPKGVEIKRFPVDKDYTDGHLAIVEMRDRGVTEVEIYGAFGGRPDHEFANYALLALAFTMNINAVIKGDYDIYYVTGKIALETKKNATVSLVPYSDTAHILSTEGLKFDASSLELNKFHLIGMSNTAVSNEIIVEVESGSILLFIQRR